jgi:hypothetical protein
VDVSGNVFVADTENRRIRKITVSGVVSTLAGLSRGNTDGIGSEAHFDSPYAIAADQTGNLYVTDMEINTNLIRKGQLVGPPMITAQPQSQTVAPGANVQFTVAAGGVPAPTYQWYINGSAFSGATTNTLSFTNARSSDAGAYTVVVTNALGSVTSNAATLTVSAAVAPPASSSSGGGGGGAPSLWFYGALALLASARRFSRVGMASPS